MDKISKERRSRNMSRIRSRDTALEIAVRKRLFALGLRYRLRSSLPGHPDIVFPRKKVAVFINGCFWHMHGCELSTIPSTRTKFWSEKLSRNEKRDHEVARKLRKMEWKVVTLWECEINKQLRQEIRKILKAISFTSD